MQKTIYYNSPIGNIKIVIENNIIIETKITQTNNTTDYNSEDTDIIKQLDKYFKGKSKSFDIKLKLIGTDFQQQVLKELLKIPYGKTLSYSDIAVKLGNKNLSRAVGNACHKNQIMIFIPCHRVIAKNGLLSGFAYGAEIKQKLLTLEQNNI